MLAAAAVPALENVALWHERDISHSSVERAIGPDATITLDFALARLTGLVDKLLVYPDRMLANLEALGGVVHSGEVLLALARAGILREDAYRIVQRNAMATWTTLGQPGNRSFRENLDADPEVAGRVDAALLDAARALSRSAGVSTPRGTSSTTTASMRMPASRARNCSSRSRCSRPEGASATNRSSASRRHTYKPMWWYNTPSPHGAQARVK